MIETARLRLRPWQDADAAEFARVTNTPAVMAQLGGVRAPEDFAPMVLRRQKLQAEHGFCFWIVERRADAALLGLCGLEPVSARPSPIDGDVEIGWRLREDAWGQGYASEAARAAIAWGWANTALARIVSFTVPANVRSWRVMERIGMTRRPDLDFGHPLFPEEHPLHRHVVYAIERAA